MVRKNIGKKNKCKSLEVSGCLAYLRKCQWQQRNTSKAVSNEIRAQKSLWASGWLMLSDGSHWKL